MLIISLTISGAAYSRQSAHLAGRLTRNLVEGLLPATEASRRTVNTGRLWVLAAQDWHATQLTPSNGEPISRRLRTP